MGKLIMVIGGTHQGKSYWIKEQISNEKINCFVYDYQNAYGENSTKKGDIITNLPIDYKIKRCRWFGSHIDFINYANRRNNSTIVIEEATIFLEGKTDSALRKLMVDRYHVNNNIIMVFHTINAVPPRIMEMSEIIVLFKTGDSETIVKRKHPKLLVYFQKLVKMPDRSKIIIKNI